VLSLNARLTLAASLVLVAFLGLTGLALERAFRDAGLAAVQDRLQGQVYTLLAAAELDAAGRLHMPAALPDGRLSSPDSGLYARIVAAGGEPLWHSPSLLGLDIPFPAPRADGVAAFAAVDAGDGRPLYALSFDVQWETAPGRSRHLGFQVAESSAILGTQLAHFRRSLWGWLGGAALALLLVQGLVMRFGLAPLRRVAVELADIESGRRQRLSASYPRELGHLTEGINAFIGSSRARLERSRHALAELAHSLKTPLAVLRGLLDGGAGEQELRATLAEQTARMHRTIDYQLQRAAASGPTPLAPAIDVAAVLARLQESLAKVYAHKKLHMEVAVEPGLGFRGDEGDLLEILGNLLDNACKWAEGRVRVRALPEGAGASDTIALRIDDDGPGIPVDQRDAVLSRGVRADTSTPGHGIGLAVVRDIVVEAYGGRVSIEASDLGGAAVSVHIPQ
jgi:two-component system, OmpR family, sensor histidine kinase PhoQ